MFDGLLKSKFYSKCKSAIKLTKTRIEMIQRKRNAMQKYLKSDIADLLKNSLDINAYGRVEGLLFELNLSSCYDFIEQFCVCISNHLSNMNKQRECPEECREAIPSLIFAAARFADLPELRELRNLFTEKYGNSLESYISQEFVQKFKSMPPTKDMKLQLMQDIALESNIEWDSKALEQKLYKPPASEQALLKNANNDEDKLHQKRDKSDREIDNQNAGFRDNNVKYYTMIERNQEDLSSPGKDEVASDGNKLYSSRENEVAEGDNQGYLSHKTQEKTPPKDIQEANIDRNGLLDNSTSVKSASKEVIDDKKCFDYRSIPPPYIKKKVAKNETSLEIPPPGSGEEGMEATKSNAHLVGEDNPRHDESIGEAKPIPRSVRSRRPKPPPDHEDVGNAKGDGKRKMNSSEKNPEDANQSRKILIGDGHDLRDEEERMVDKLLVHYSTKQSPSEQGKVDSALKPPPSQHVVDAGKATRNKSKDGITTRATSLPAEQRSPEAAAKGHARASSFEPELLNPRGHVHPKLPDYDDFLARFAALKGK